MAVTKNTDLLSKFLFSVDRLAVAVNPHTLLEKTSAEITINIFNRLFFMFNFLKLHFTSIFAKRSLQIYYF